MCLFSTQRNGWARVVGISLLLLFVACPQARAEGPTLIVTTADSSERAKKTADFVADGIGDQEQIHAALKALPKTGGTIELMAETYGICKVTGTLGV